MNEELIKINKEKRSKCSKVKKIIRKNVMKCYKDGKWREVCNYDECQYHIPSNLVGFI